MPPKLPCKPLVLLFCFLIAATANAQKTALAPSKRTTIPISQQQWKYLKDSDPAGAADPGFDDTGWKSVGLPYSADQSNTYLNLESGGGEGQLDGNVNWYRFHFALDPKYKNSRVIVEFEGVHTGAQVYVNGQFLKGNSAINPLSTHVVGFVGFAVDLTSAGNLRFDGSDNVLAVKGSKNDPSFKNPGFSQAFRFGQHDAGIFRPVSMYIVDPIHIPLNTSAGLGTWGTYVATTAATEDQATVRVQTNVLNQGTTDQLVTLTTQIVDESGTVVSQQQDARTVYANNDTPAVGQVFDQTFTIAHPNLWWPNASKFRKRDHSYMYRVFHTVSVNGVVVDAVESPLGIRTINWNKDLPLINGQPHHLYGASGRYGYPGLGTSVPEEQQWRDLELLADAGGNLYRPGHSSQSPEFVAAADAYGIFIVQPSGDGENAFAAHCDAAPCDMQTLKLELHRDMIIRDRNHPSILTWEANNGQMDTSLAQQLAAVGKQWDYLAPRVQADRTPLPTNGDILSCSRQGCEWAVKQTYPDNPAYGAEYWGNGIARDKWDWQIAFAASYLNDWRHGLVGNTFGIAHWYLADEPGEINTQQDGSPAEGMRANAASMMDANRFKRPLYDIYRAAWTPYEVAPVVSLVNHWNRNGNVRVNVFSNCPAVRLLINGVPQGQDKTPNPATSDASADLTENTTLLPFQTHWDVAWQAGTVQADCLDAYGNVVAEDHRTTAGVPTAVQLEVVPDVVKPTTGEAFAVTANGSDAAFVIAKIVDKDGNVVPTASNNVTFAVTGPATYMGGTDAYVTAGKGLNYHAPGDPELAAEAGLTKIALRSTFQTGDVTVTATSPGLLQGTATLTIHPIKQTAPTATAPAILVQPVDTSVTEGQPAKFLVTATGADPLHFQWRRNGLVLTGATDASYTTIQTSSADNGAIYTVEVSNELGTALSAGATLTVVKAAAPVISSQPQSQTVAAGQTAMFAITAAGSPTLKAQWFRNGIGLNATELSYTTGVLETNDSGSTYTVTVTNPVGTVSSVPANLTVSPAIAPSIVSQPQNVAVLRGNSATFTVQAAGTDPMSYTWFRGTSTVGTNSPTLTIDSVDNSSVGDYYVVVTNHAGSITSATASLKLAAPGVNLALGKVATSSADENGGLGPMLAIDGNPDTRWGSYFDDNQWIQIDLGAVLAFDRIVLKWDPAYATDYAIQVSNDAQNWSTAYSQSAGVGGTEDFGFPTQRARYVRMLGLKRNTTTYGFSIHEFELYNAPVAGDDKERYSVIDANSVRDNMSTLVWMRAQYGLPPELGQQFTLSKAAAYCSAKGMRLPSRDEALAISADNAVNSAFPQAWITWVTDLDPTDNTYGYQVNSLDGHVNRVVAENNPGWALCTQGAMQVSPTITAQPTAQTAAAGTNAQFSVTSSANNGATYEWRINEKAIAVTGVPTYRTPNLTDANDDEQYSVRIIDTNGLSTTSSSALLTVTPATEIPGNPGNDPGNGGGGNPPAPDCPVNPGVVPPGPNLAVGKAALSSADEPGEAFPAKDAFDANLNTRWSSFFGTPEWIQVDLGTPQLIGQVILRWERAHGTKYTIDVSTDGVNWTSVFVQNNGQGCVESLVFQAVTARYVRMYGLAKSSDYGFSLYEFEVYAPVLPIIKTNPVAQTVTSGSTASFSVEVEGNGPFTYQWFKNGVAIAGATSAMYTTPVLAITDDANSYYVEVSNSAGTVFSAQASIKVNPPVADRKNLALGAIATSSGDEDGGAFPARDAIDGNIDTRWSSQFNAPEWLQIDLGRAQNISEVVLHWERAYGVQYLIQTSTDAVVWNTVFSQSAGVGGAEDIVFSPITARYVRMYGTQRSSQYGFSLYEMEVYPPAPSFTATTATK